MNIVRSTLSQTETDAGRIMRGAIYNLQKLTGSARPVLKTKWNKLMGLDTTLWLTSLWQWMSDHDQILDTKTIIRTPRRDVCIMDEYIRKLHDKLTAEQHQQLLQRQPYKSATKPPAELADWGLKVTTLREGLWENRITTMTELTEGKRRGYAKLRHTYDSTVNPGSEATKCD